MAIKFELVKPGDKLWQKMRQKAGNTNLTRWAVFEVEIVSVDEHGATVIWNGNRPVRWSARNVSKLYRNRPAA